MWTTGLCTYLGACVCMCVCAHLQVFVRTHAHGSAWMWACQDACENALVCVPVVSVCEHVCVWELMVEYGCVGVCVSMCAHVKWGPTHWNAQAGSCAQHVHAAQMGCINSVLC